MSFFNELKRRNVFKVAAAYVIVGWLLLQVADVVVGNIEAPDWVFQVIMLLLGLGLPVALIFAWAFEMTPEGIKKEKDVDRSQSITQSTGRKLDFTIIGLLAVALAYFVWESRFSEPGQPKKSVAQVADSTRADALKNPASATKDDKSIVVLPFVNMSSDPEQEFFSDGLSEELLNLLAKIPELKVTSRSSAFSFKGQNIDIPTVAEKLGVAHVLEGSVRKSGNRVRITAQLIEADSDVHMWSETYDRELDDVFAIQDEIAQAVVSALQIKLLGELPTTETTDTEAYTLYLQGKHFNSLSTEDGYRSADAAYKKAIAIDPDYAQAWAGLSFTLRNQANWSYIDLHQGTEAARQAAQRALELDSGLAEAWSALAAIQVVYDWDWEQAKGSILTALQYGPRHADALQNAASIFRYRGLYDQAVDYARRAVETDPLSRTALRSLGITYWGVGRHAEARATYLRMLELYPEQVDMHAFIATSYVLEGRPEEGLHEVAKEKHGMWVNFARSMILHSLGQTEEADLALQQLMAENPVGMDYQFATVNAWQGKSDQAFFWLEKAVENRDGGIAQLLADPFIASLYNDPRWEPLLDRVGLLKYWQEMQAKKQAEAS